MNFNNIIKVVSLLMAAYFIFLFSGLVNALNKENNGRYEMYGDGAFIIDTRTGIIYLANLEELKTLKSSN